MEVTHIEGTQMGKLGIFLDYSGKPRSAHLYIDANLNDAPNAALWSQGIACPKGSIKSHRASPGAHHTAGGDRIMARLGDFRFGSDPGD